MSDTALETAVFRCAVALGMVEAPEAVTLRCFFGLVWLLYLDGEAAECFWLEYLSFFVERNFSKILPVHSDNLE